MEESISTSVSTVRLIHPQEQSSSQNMASASSPSSPHSSALPSPADSPSSCSVSSLPSVSSSFFFSSAAASPGQQGPNADLGLRDSAQSLIIPSLALPTALRQPTPYGKTLGELRVLILGSKGMEKGFLSRLFSEDNEDVVDVGRWEELEYGRMLRASTDWIEHHDGFGLEKFEPTRNVEIIELPEYDANTTHADNLLRKLKSIIHAPFYAVSEVLDPTHRPSPVLAGLVSSASTPLYTALILLLPSTPSPLDKLVIDTLSQDIPIVLLPRLPTPNRTFLSSTSKLSSFRPSSVLTLRHGLFHSPETIAVLRSEAADRFLRWREVERAVDDIQVSRRNEALRGQNDNRNQSNNDHGNNDNNLYNPYSLVPEEGVRWDKVMWELEWEQNLSHDVAKRLREGGSGAEQSAKNHGRGGSPERRGKDAKEPAAAPPSGAPLDDAAEVVGRSRHRNNNNNDVNSYSPQFDPLHLPSLVMFSLSLLGPLRTRMVNSLGLRPIVEAIGEYSVKIALLGGFCVGFGAGFFFRAS